MPASTRATGKSTSFIARKTSSSSESRLTVIRDSPASASARAFWASSAALVVSVTSSHRRARQAGRRALRGPAEERLAARDPELLHAEVDEHARDARSISSNVRELATGQEAVVVPEHLFRHAVHAAEVAAVGDRDPEIGRAGRGCRSRSSVISVENPGGDPACAPPRPRRRHRDLGRHVRPGEGRDRALPVVRVPRRSVRDLDGRARSVRLALPADDARSGYAAGVAPACCSRSPTASRPQGSS